MSGHLGLSVCPAWFWAHNQHPLWNGVRTLPWTSTCRDAATDAPPDAPVGASGQQVPDA